MSRIITLFILLYSSVFVKAQVFEQLVLSDFEREIYSSEEAIVMDFGLIGSFPSFMGNEFLQIHSVKARGIGTSGFEKSALVISHSPHRKNIAVRDFIDGDEIESLIQALVYYKDKMMDNDSKLDQSFVWTSRGGYQFRADFVRFPKRHSAFSRINNFDATQSLSMLSNKRIDEFINSIRKVKSVIE